MSKKTLLWVLSLLPLLCADNVVALDRAGFDELTTIMDSAKVMETDVFSPKMWEKATKKFVKAQEAVTSNRKQKTVNKKVAEAREFAENAIKASEVAKLTLQEYLDPRQKARVAKAPSLVPKLYVKAEKQFVKATKKVESGDVKGALKEAAKARPLFDTAELEAIRADILGTADRLIKKANADDAKKFALSTLDKAVTAREKANNLITSDRYDRAPAVKLADRAKYEARHASNIALSVRALKRNDQAWEKLMLVYEIQLDRVGQAADLEHLPFDNGPLAAADTLINYIRQLQVENDQLMSEIVALNATLSGQLRQTLERLGQTPSESDPLILAEAVDKRISDLIVEKSALAEQMAVSQSKLTELSKEHEDVTADLSSRKELEEKFKKAKRVLNPSEGEVLFNSSNDIVLRLGGLSFDIGKADIKDEHILLLEKVKKIIDMFPDAHLVVEGHTDASGELSANVLLSEKRAFAVMQYLRQSLLIPVDRIKSMGYGADRPIASNQSQSGRAKNRRIDVIVMR